MHEKAILGAIIPLTFMSTAGVPEARRYIRMSALGHFALFPLLTEARETMTKLLLFVAHLVLAHALLRRVVMPRPAGKQSVAKSGAPKRGAAATSLLTWFDWLYLAAMAALFVFAELVHPIVLVPRGKLEFLPLMLTSVLCGSGLMLLWIEATWGVLRSQP